MKLLVDCHVFDGKFSGVRTYIQGIYSNMTKHKDIDFYFVAQDTENLKIIFGESTNVHYVKLQMPNKFKRLAIEYPRIIKGLQIDYAHFQYICPIIKKCKEIVTLHDLLFREFPQYFPLKYRLEKNYFFYRSAKRADILLTVSDYSKEEICRYYNIPSNSIFITPNAVLPTEKQKNTSILEKWDLKKYILTVSRVEPRKNHLDLLKAFVELDLANVGYKLLMIGVVDISYKEFNDYYEMLPENIKEKVIIKPVPFDDLVTLYKNASLFVFPSFAEGFGIPPLEAIEYGCPVLCSNQTAMKDFCLPDEIIFNPYNHNELLTKMDKLLKSYPDMTSLRNRLRQKYNWGVIADDFYQLLMRFNDGL